MTRCHTLFVAIALLLASGFARADYPCIADTPLTRLAGPTEIIGSVPVEVATAAGEATGWWCLDAVTATTPPGKVTFSRWYQYSLAKHRGHPDLRGAMKRVLAAPNLLAAVNGEMRAGSIAAPAGSQDEYEIKVLLRNACIALTTPPYSVPIDPPPAGVCGAAPVPAGQSGDVYRTPASGAFTLFTHASGRLAGVISGRRATANALCNCSAARATSGSTVYCALASGAATEVTTCVKASP